MDLFKGLEELGFKNIDVKIYEEKNEQKQSVQTKEQKENPEDSIYEKTFKCPVCEQDFKNYAVKSNKYRLIKTDTDFMPIYDGINPLFYDIVICPFCGYSRLQSMFNSIRPYQIPILAEKITANFKSRVYPKLYTVDIAIERYKLALLVASVIQVKDSEKAFLCLKLAWLYRIKQDKPNEELFLKEALRGFTSAFSSEKLPVFNLGKHELMYLLGDLSIRIGDHTTANRYLSEVIVTPKVNSKIKELSRDRRDAIRQYLKKY